MPDPPDLATSSNAVASATPSPGEPAAAVRSAARQRAAAALPDVLLIRGCPRSGTTLVAELVNASDDAAVIFEYPLGQLVLDLQPIFGYARAHRSLRAKITGDGGDPADDGLYYNPPRKEALGRFPTEERLGAIVTAVVEASLSKRDVAVIGSKTPGVVALRDADILTPLFPTIKHAFVVRSPLATVNSMMNRRNRARLGLDDWPFADVAAAIAEYRVNLRLLFSHVARRPDRCLVLKYEDLLTGFAGAAGALSAFLGPRFDLVRDAEKFWAGGLRTPGETKDVLTPDEHAALRAALGPVIDAWDGKALTGLHPGSVDALADCADRLVPGEPYRYDDPLGERRFLGLGWSVLQREGVWTDSERADLFFTVPDDGDYTVAVEASFFLPDAAATLSLRVDANGTDVLRACVSSGRTANGSVATSAAGTPHAAGTPDADVTGAGPHRLVCGPVRLAGRGVQRLSLHVDPVRSPLACGISNDDRRLGVLLHGLVLARA